jgi:hypothetical protein
MATFSDFVTATPGTANTEAASATTLSIPAGARIKQLVIANPDCLGFIYSIRLDWSGIKSPQKFTMMSAYDTTGTEVEYVNSWPEEVIDVDIPIEKNITLTAYATADVNSTKCVIGIVWEQ